jgi:ABC-type multidrug transport system fused ATPase/permease subunit
MVDEIKSGVFFSWFSPILKEGASKQLDLEDLPPLPTSFQSRNTYESFSETILNCFPTKPNSKSERKVKKPSWLNNGSFPDLGIREFGSMHPLLQCIIHNHADSIVKIFLLKMVSCGLSFASPLLLGQLVSFLSGTVTLHNLHDGILWVSLLTIAAVLSAAINTNSNARSLDIKLKLQSALTVIVFERIAVLPMCALDDISLTSAQLLNFVQVDIEQVANFIQTVNDVWSLPVQIAVAFALLYLQISISFLAGIAVILIMIPLNSIIARQFGWNTENLLKNKDARCKLILEALNAINAVKMTHFETAILHISNQFREKEIIYLSRRKYLDAVCVFLWAVTPVFVPYITFTTSVLIRGEDSLSASQVITSIALLNMLIFPMNALPWVLNGFMEARVSLRRLSKLLNHANNKELDVFALLRSSSHRVSSYTYTTKPSFSTTIAGANVKQPPLLLSVPWARYNNNINNNNNNNNNTASSSTANTTPNVNSSTTHTTMTSQQFSVALREPLHLESGSLCVLTGRTGCGKSSLLLAFLYELRAAISPQLPVSHSDSANANNNNNNNNNNSMNSYNSNNSISMIHHNPLSTVYSEEAIALLQTVFDPVRDVEQEILSISTDLSAGKSRVHLPERLSYSAQSAEMFTGSIRDNILAGTSYDAGKYDRILRGCALLDDLEHTWQREGDRSEVGPTGNRLSGGQRTRLSVARALYANTRTVLLDDPFAALDRPTATHLFRFLIEEMHIHQRIIIVATHSLDLLQHAHTDSAENPLNILLILLEEGKEVMRGSYRELAETSSLFQQLISEKDQSHDNNNNDNNNSNNSNNHNADLNLSHNSKKEDNPNDLAASSLSRSPAGPLEADEIIEATSLQPLAIAKLETEKRKDDEDIITKEEEEEERQVGRIASSVYLRYLEYVGLCVLLGTLIATCFMQISAAAMTFWLGFWASQQEDFSVQEFLWISSLIVGVNVLCTTLRSFLFAFAGLKAARKLYEDLATSVFHTSTTFFEKRVIGQISNRFGKDSNAIDDSLPFIANILLAQCFQLLGAVLVMVYNDAFILVVIVLVVIFYYRLQHYYRESSREFRRLDSIYRSPVYNLLHDICQCAVTVRSLPDTSFHWMRHRLFVALDESLRVTLSLNIASQWLNMRLQLLGSCITATLAISILINRLVSILPISPGLAGLSLLYSYNIVNYLNGFVNALAETEQEMISVERVLEYARLPSETAAVDSTVDDGEQTSRGSAGRKQEQYSLLSGNDHYDEEAAATSIARTNPIAAEPSLAVSLLDGEISHSQVSRELVVSNVTLHYENSSVAALKALSFHLLPGQKLAVVGRTGSGKSSLLKCLLRLHEYEGSIMLNGKNIVEMELGQLRGQYISTVTQNPMLFSTSIRFNLDPFQDHEDDEIFAMLSDIGFIASIVSDAESAGKQKKPITIVDASDLEDMKTFLDRELEQAGAALSLGQCMLLSLARVLLRRSLVIALDEVNSSLDRKTHLLVLQALQKHCQRYPETIVIAVCHRLEDMHLLCTHLLKLDHGERVEFGEYPSPS